MLCQTCNPLETQSIQEGFNPHTGYLPESKWKVALFLIMEGSGALNTSRQIIVYVKRILQEMGYAAY